MDSTILDLASALGWGLVSVAGLAVGAFIGLYGSLTHRSVAATMAVATGLPLAAATVELAANAIEIAPSAAGLLALHVGALAFSGANAALGARGAADRKHCGECVAQPQEALAPGRGLAIALGTAMNAIPEAGAWRDGEKRWTADGADHCHLARQSARSVVGLGGDARGRSKAGLDPVGVGCRRHRYGGAYGVGFVLAGSTSPGTSAVLELFGAGALIAMVTETIIPEAVHGAPRLAGTVAALGFAGLPLVGQMAHCG